MRLRVLAAAAVSVALALPAFGQQAQTLADIRAELAVLYGDILSLKSELEPTGTGSSASMENNMLDRVVSIEQSLEILTARTEELEYRVNRIVSDGTNRVGDLEFRLCELEANCDIGSLGETPSLGGGEATPVGPVLGGSGSTEGEQLAVAEQADFEAAQQAMEDKQYQEAEQRFKNFLETYPSGPLGVKAQIGRGQALELLGDPREAGRAFLAAYSLNPQGPEAPFALLQLGRMMAAIGQFDEACVMLGEVGRRFPSSNSALDASDQMLSLSCR